MNRVRRSRSWSRSSRSQISRTMDQRMQGLLGPRPGARTRQSSTRRGARAAPPALSAAARAGTMGAGRGWAMAKKKPAPKEGLQGEARRLYYRDAKHLILEIGWQGNGGVYGLDLSSKDKI